MVAQCMNNTGVWSWRAPKGTIVQVPFYEKHSKPINFQCVNFGVRARRRVFPYVAMRLKRQKTWPHPFQLSEY